MRNKSTTQKKLIKIITTPYRAICKAKDFYVRSITNHTTNGTAALSTRKTLSRSTSTSSYGHSNAASEDLRELIRANSTTSMRGHNISTADVELYIKQHTMMNSGMGPQRVPRSVSVGMGRIDEDAPVTSFPDDLDLRRNVKSGHMMFPRSKSHAVTNSIMINRFS
ncbi:hypothetical protein CTI12_AA463400 [Artemisia annua]|uniref:Uncharacterized protein n=1 Tax=Artemisia annua TaxID=35608 RepID=A0A2U1LRL4_ARTAN|nr:hypothetical protein CTI12_AA463400 [Artemisia annua]